MADYDRLLAAWSADPQAHDDVVHWRIDRLGALKARSRNAEVLSEAQKLTDEGVTIPPYAQRWIASAYLAVREPEKAVALYRQILSSPSADPVDQAGDTSALVYALMESDQPEEARALADALALTVPPRLPLKGDPGGVPNDAWLDAQQLSAQMAMDNGDQAGAEQRLEALVRAGTGQRRLAPGPGRYVPVPRLAAQCRGLEQGNRKCGRRATWAWKLPRPIPPWRCRSGASSTYSPTTWPNVFRRVRRSRAWSVSALSTTWPSCGSRPIPARASAVAQVGPGAVTGSRDYGI